jgi:hypothetical protein
MANAEEAIRTFLQYRKDPDALVEDERLTQLRERLESSGDPIERLQLHAEIARLLDPARFEAAFIDHAKPWADEHGISAAAFEAEGVSRDVLRRAGLINGRAGRQRQARRSRVTAEEIRASIPGRGKAFTIKDVQDDSGGSAATVRKVITEMLGSGELEEVGPDPDHKGPGRAATRYKKTSKRRAEG